MTLMQQRQGLKIVSPVVGAVHLGPRGIVLLFSDPDGSLRDLVFADAAFRSAGLGVFGPELADVGAVDEGGCAPGLDFGLAALSGLSFPGKWSAGSRVGDQLLHFFLKC